MPAVARAPQTRALRTYLADTTGHPVGPGRAPDETHGWQGAPGQSPFVGYYVVHSIAGGGHDGSLTDPYADAELVWQVNAHGASQDHAEQLADEAQAVLLGAVLPPLVIAGAFVRWVAPDITGGAARQDPDQPSIWTTSDRYRIATTPTA